jgi:hypothetical protein
MSDRALLIYHVLLDSVKQRLAGRLEIFDAGSVREMRRTAWRFGHILCI